MAERADVRRSRSAAATRPAHSVLHRQPRHHLPLRVRLAADAGYDAVAHFPLMTDYQLSAVPLFIFMAAILEKAGIIEELFDVVYKWLGGVRGGLASATVIVCTVLAAIVGVV